MNFEERVIAQFKALPQFHDQEVICGIGDDAAVIKPPASSQLVMTTDVMVEGVHFLRDNPSPFDLGQKSVAVNLSDVAAMGAEAKYLLVSLSLPVGFGDEWLQHYLKGLNKVCTRYQVQVIGGDTTASNKDLMISVTALGWLQPNHLKRRSEAQPGDKICVTGSLGASSFVFRNLNNKQWQSLQEASGLKRHWSSPEAHLPQASVLRQFSQVHSLMDISDGLFTDLHRLCLASQCGARVEVEKLPLAAGLDKASSALRQNPVDHAIAGGEDYCLLCTVAPSGLSQLDKSLQDQGLERLHVIGTITDDHGEVCFYDRGEPYNCELVPYTHFQDKNYL